MAVIDVAGDVVVVSVVDVVVVVYIVAVCVVDAVVVAKPDQVSNFKFPWKKYECSRKQK